MILRNREGTKKMTSKIDFKNFKNGDNVIITILDEGKEKTLFGKITNISLSKRFICFENDDSEYEFKFSEIRTMTQNVNKNQVTGLNCNTFIQYIKSFFYWKGCITRKELLTKSLILFIFSMILPFLIVSILEMVILIKARYLAYMATLSVLGAELIFMYGTSCLLKQCRNDFSKARCVLGTFLALFFSGFFSIILEEIFLSVFDYLTTIASFFSILVRYCIFALTLYYFSKLKSKTKILLVDKSRLLKECQIGFSWTTLFFGPFVPLTRGDLKWFFIMLIFAITIVGWIAMFVFCFKYNKLYIKDCLEKGYKPYDKQAVDILKDMGIYYAK